MPRGTRAGRSTSASTSRGRSGSSRSG